MPRVVRFALLVSLAFGCLQLVVQGAEDSKLWIEFKQAIEAGAVPPVTDFSYAGYHAGERSLPDADWAIFDVRDYGAVADDGVSDKQAIQRAVDAAVSNGSGIVYFPKGRFRVNESTDVTNQSIRVRGGRIVFRGAGAEQGGTELFMAEHMEAADPKKMWSAPYLFRFEGGRNSGKSLKITESMSRGSRELVVDGSTGLNAGDWIVLQLRDNSEAGIREAVFPHEFDPRWKHLAQKGVQVNAYHCIQAVEGNRLFLREALHLNVDRSKPWTVQKWYPAQEVGVEDIAFVGNWQERFDHHQSAVHDGGWSLLQFVRCADGWLRRCRFSHVNRAVVLTQCASMTVERVVLDGNPGHNALTLNGTSNSLVRDSVDECGHHHSFGVAGTSIGNVFCVVVILRIPAMSPMPPNHDGPCLTM